MSTTAVPPKPHSVPLYRQGPVPTELRNGDSLTQEDFDRLYDQTPEGFRAQLIEGEVFIVQDAIGVESHGEPEADLATWLGTYRAATPGVLSSTAATIILDAVNELEPDLHMRFKPECGGKSKVIGKKLRGAPEVVCEISYSSRSIDLGRKKRAYERNGIQEYLVWRTEDRALDWWELQQGVYRPLLRTENGIIESRVFPGLILDVPAIVSGDVAAVLERQRSQLGQGKHLDFCRELERRRRGE